LTIDFLLSTDCGCVVRELSSRGSQDPRYGRRARSARLQPRDPATSRRGHCRVFRTTCSGTPPPARLAALRRTRRTSAGRRRWNSQTLSCWIWSIGRRSPWEIARTPQRSILQIRKKFPGGH